MAPALFKTSRFLGDYRKIVITILAANPDAAERFCDSLEDTLIMLARHPQIGRLARFSRTPKARRWRVKDFPNYIIYYEIRDDGVLLLRLLHGARHASPLVEE